MLWLLLALFFRLAPAVTVRGVWLTASIRGPPAVLLDWINSRLELKEWYSPTPQEGKLTFDWTIVLLCAPGASQYWQFYHHFELTDEEWIELMVCPRTGISWQDTIDRYDIWNTDKYDFVFGDLMPKYVAGNGNWPPLSRCPPNRFPSQHFMWKHCIPMEWNAEKYWCNKLGDKCPPNGKPKIGVLKIEELARQAEEHGMPMVTAGNYVGIGTNFWKNGQHGKYVTTPLNDLGGYFTNWFKYLVDIGAKKLTVINSVTEFPAETCADVDPMQADDFALFEECLVLNVGWYNYSHGKPWATKPGNKEPQESKDAFAALKAELNGTDEVVRCAWEDYPKNETWIRQSDMTACDCPDFRCKKGRLNEFNKELMLQHQKQHKADVAVIIPGGMKNWDNITQNLYDYSEDKPDLYYKAIGRDERARGNPAWRVETLRPEVYAYMFTARGANYFAPGTEKVYDDSLNVANLFPPEDGKTGMEIFYEGFWQFYWKKIQTEPKTMSDGTLQMMSVDERMINIYLSMWQQFYQVLIAARKACTKTCSAEIMNNALHSINADTFFGQIDVNSTGYNRNTDRPITQHKWQTTPVDYNNVVFPPTIQSKGDVFIYPMPVYIDKPCYPDCHVCTKPDLCDQLGEIALMMVMVYVPASVVFMIVFLIMGYGWVYSNEKGIAFSFNVMSGTTSACSVLTIWHLKDHLIDFPSYIIILLAIFGGIDGGWNFINLAFDIIEVGFYKEWQETSFMINCNGFFGPIMAAVDATNACLGMYVLFNSKLVYTPDSMTVIIDVIINCLEAMNFMFDTMDRILKCLDGMREDNQEKE